MTAFEASLATRAAATARAAARGQTPGHPLSTEGSGRTGLVAALLLMTLGQPQPARGAFMACHRHWLDTRGRRLAGAD